MLPLIFDKVSFHAGGRNLIDSVSLEFTAGPRSILLGANGAGKSLLMRLCHGLLMPTSGSIRYSAKGRQAMVFQRPVMLRRSAIDNVVYGLHVIGTPRKEARQRADDALNAVGLAALAARPARVLSGGEQQRLALARAWALRPAVLFLDEPTANLDPGATREIEQIITAIHTQGTKIIMSTHSLGQARRLGDEIYFLAGGRLVEKAPVLQFFSAPQSDDAQAFLKEELP